MQALLAVVREVHGEPLGLQPALKRRGHPPFVLHDENPHPAPFPITPSSGSPAENRLRSLWALSVCLSSGTGPLTQAAGGRD
nr:hypothetical protein GCM10020093_005930 [Planobispora longispora]